MPKSRRTSRDASRKNHSHRRARRLPPRAPATWAELVEKVLTDPANAGMLQRLRWSFFADSGPYYLDPTGSKRHDEAAAQGRFIEWALLNYRPIPSPLFDPFPGLRDWLDANGVDLTADGPFSSWARSVEGAFLVETYRAGAGTLTALDGGRTFSVSGLSHLNVIVGDVLVGRLLPGTGASGESWTPSPSTVVAPPETRAMVRERLAAGVRTGGDDDASGDDPDQWPLMSETWLGATPWWPAADIGMPALLSDVEEFFDDVEIDLAPAFLLSELALVDDPAVVWSRLAEDLPLATPAEFLLFASFTTALWATTSQTTLAKLGSGDDQAFYKWFGETALALATHSLERAADPKAPEPPLPAPREGVWAPSRELSQRLSALPHTESTWMGERRSVRLVRTRDDGVPEYWHAIVWVDEEHEEVVATSLCPANAPHDELWRVFAQAATAPAVGQPRLPAVALSARLQNAAAAHASLSGLGVAVDVTYAYTDLEDAFLAIEERLAEDPGYQADPDVLTRYLALPTNTPADVAEMFAAAAELYRLQPWTIVSRDLLVSMVIDDDPDARVSAWAPDASRPELKIYRDMWTLLEMATVDIDEDDVAADAIYVTFPAMKPGRDPLLKEAETHRWPLARNRYPVMAVQASPDAPPRLVCGHEVRLVTAMLHAWCALVDAHRTALSAGRPCGPVHVETHGHRVAIEATSGSDVGASSV